MSRYSQLTALLLSNAEPQVALSFDELDGIIHGGLSDSAKKYPSRWTNKEESRAHAKS